MRITEHTIDIRSVDSIKQAPSRVPLAYAEVEKNIKELEEKSVIPRVIRNQRPKLLVKKESGKNRPCVGCRTVNGLVKQTLCIYLYIMLLFYGLYYRGPLGRVAM